MKQKIFTLFLALAASAGTIFADGTKIGDLYYNLDATNKTAEVTYEKLSNKTNYSGLTTANIPSSVDYESVPYSVTSIGNYAFSGCSGLTSVTIPNSVTSIGYGAFEGCSGLTSVTIPNSVTSIGNNAFNDCTGLTSVTIGNSVTSIGDGAFRNCSGLTSVTIPNSVTSIGDGAFGFCTGLTSVTIPNSVTEIGGGAFWDCTGLTSVTIPNSVTSIGSFAFRDCTGLTSIEIPNSVTSIGFEAFYGCSGLTSVTIPNSVTSIGYGAFGYCSGLTSVAIPNSVTSIGEYAFERCTGLTSITCEASTPPTCESGVFDGVDKSIPLYVPAESVEAYKAAYQWKDFGDNIKPIQAAEADVTEIEAEPTDNSVVIGWPKVEGATVYTIQIWKGDELICTLSFNEQGQLLTISFEKKSGKNPSRNATQAATGWQYTINGLDAGTEYTYIVVAKKGDEELFNETKQFTTTGAEALDEILESSDTEVLKFIKNGQLFILRNGEIYNASGARVE